MIVLSAPLVLLLAMQHPAAAQDRPDTLREALKGAGFEVPDSVVPADLDREWTSSGWSYDDTRFVAAIYFRDEMPRDMILGPLHLIQITKTGKVDRLRLTGDDGIIRGGAIRAVSVQPGIAFVTTHFTPSAGFILVAEPLFTRVTTLPGFGAQVLPDGTLAFKGNMVHFADYHQQTLKQHRTSNGETVEIYPGAMKSPVHDRATRAIRKRFEAMSFDKEAREHEADRSIDAWRASADGGRVALLVGYDSMRLIAEGIPAADHEIVAIARCDRRNDSWTCSEHPLADVARRYKMIIPDTSPAAREAAVNRLLERVLSEQ